MKKQIMDFYDGVLEEYFKDMRSILYTKRPLKVQLKMLYAARNKAEYYIRLNHGVLNEHLQNK